MIMQHQNTNEQYIILYNGNAEVVGNFRALNFYKASDINIKEDIRLITECKSGFTLHLKESRSDTMFFQLPMHVMCC